MSFDDKDADDFTGAEPAEKDLVADFLKREQDELADLQENFGILRRPMPLQMLYILHSRFPTISPLYASGSQAVVRGHFRGGPQARPNI